MAHPIEFKDVRGLGNVIPFWDLIELMSDLHMWTPLSVSDL